VKRRDAVTGAEPHPKMRPSADGGRSCPWVALAFAVAYLIAYALASYLDLHTTLLALRRAGVREGNLYSVTASGYASARAWVITAVGGLVLEGFVVFSLLNASSVSERWLHRPIRSFGRFYIVPWSKGVIDRSPLHALSFAIAFVALRLLAAGNNMLIHFRGVAPLGGLVEAVSARAGQAVGFWLVLGVLICVLGVACSPLAARCLAWFRRWPPG